MGGNCLKETFTRRYQADEFHALSKEVSEKLARLFPYSRNEVLKAYRNKESFGDMDIVLCSENLPENYIEMVKAVFKPTQVVKNSNCVSFDYKELQIDLIVTVPEEYETSLSYFAYNDANNMIGRLAHMMGLKLGHDGLSYNWRIETYQFKNIILETDWNKILPILGYDPEVYNKGFDDLEDIFKFVVSSPFFNKDIFLLHNRNHTSRVRDAKRKTYMEFLKWIENRDDLPNYPRKEDKKEWLPYLFDQIPGFESVYYRTQNEYDMEVQFKEKFNGGLVMELTGLTGKELGDFVKFMDTKNEVFKNFVLKCPQEEINQDILENFEEYKNETK